METWDKKKSKYKMGEKLNDPSVRKGVTSLVNRYENLQSDETKILNNNRFQKAKEKGLLKSSSVGNNMSEMNLYSPRIYNNRNNFESKNEHTDQDVRRESWASPVQNNNFTGSLYRPTTKKQDLLSLDSSYKHIKTEANSSHTPKSNPPQMLASEVEMPHCVELNRLTPERNPVMPNSVKLNRSTQERNRVMPNSVELNRSTQERNCQMPNSVELNRSTQERNRVSGLRKMFHGEDSANQNEHTKSVDSSEKNIKQEDSGTQDVGIKIHITNDNNNEIQVTPKQNQNNFMTMYLPKTSGLRSKSSERPTQKIVDKKEGRYGDNSNLVPDMERGRSKSSDRATYRMYGQRQNQHKAFTSNVPRTEKERSKSSDRTIRRNPMYNNIRPGNDMYSKNKQTFERGRSSVKKHKLDDSWITSRSLSVPADSKKESFRSRPKNYETPLQYKNNCNKEENNYQTLVDFTNTPKTRDANRRDIYTIMPQQNDSLKVHNNSSERNIEEEHDYENVPSLLKPQISPRHIHPMAWQSQPKQSNSHSHDSSRKSSLKAQNNGFNNITGSVDNLDDSVFETETEDPLVRYYDADINSSRRSSAYSQEVSPNYTQRYPSNILNERPFTSSNNNFTLKSNTVSNIKDVQAKHSSSLSSMSVHSAPAARIVDIETETVSTMASHCCESLGKLHEIHRTLSVGFKNMSKSIEFLYDSSMFTSKKIEQQPLEELAYHRLFKYVSEATATENLNKACWRSLLKQLLYMYPEWFVQRKERSIENVETSTSEKVHECLIIWREFNQFNCDSEKIAALKHALRKIGMSSKLINGIDLVVQMEEESNNFANVLTDQRLTSLALEIGKEWRLLAIYLGHTQQYTERLAENHHGNIGAAIQKMLIDWRDAHNSNVDMLVRAFMSVERRDLVEKLYTVYQLLKKSP